MISITTEFRYIGNGADSFKPGRFALSELVSTEFARRFEAMPKFSGPNCCNILFFKVRISYLDSVVLEFCFANSQLFCCLSFCIIINYDQQRNIESFWAEYFPGVWYFIPT